MHLGASDRRGKKLKKNAENYHMFAAKFELLSQNLIFSMCDSLYSLSMLTFVEDRFCIKNSPLLLNM